MDIKSRYRQMRQAGKVNNPLDYFTRGHENIIKTGMEETADLAGDLRDSARRTYNKGKGFLDKKINEVRQKMNPTAGDPSKGRGPLKTKGPAPAPKPNAADIARGTTAPKPTTGNVRGAVRGAARRAIGPAIGALDTASQISRGENPLYAVGRTVTGALSGSMAAAGTTLLYGEPSPVGINLASGISYAGGYKTGTELFDKGMNAIGITSTARPMTLTGQEPSSKSANEPTAQLSKTPPKPLNKSGLQPGINPRTGKPYSETPGKADNEAEATLVPVRPAQPEVRQPTAALSDTETIVNNNGMRQTGRNLTTIARGDGGSPYLEGAGGLFDNLGLGTGVTINRQWSSNQLPGTDTALYGGKPQSQQLGEGDQQVVLSQNLDEDGGAVRNLESMPLEAFQESQGVKADGIDSSQSEGGGSRNWMKPRELSAKEARRAAFLDAPNSMAGMRAVDAQLGRVRSGDSFYYANPDTSEGASEFIKVGLADGRAHQNDQLSGQDLLAKYTSGIKETMRAEEADTPSPAEFHPAMEIEQAGEVLNSYTQNGFHPDMEEEQFKAINY